MKKLYKRFGALLVVLAMLLCMSACDPSGTTEKPAEPLTTQPAETTPVETTPVETTPAEDLLQKELAEKYEAAVAATSEDSVGLEVQFKRDLTVAGQKYKDSGSISLAYWNLGQEDFLAQARTTHVFGNFDYKTALVEIYSDGIVYQTLDKTKFYAELSAEEYIARLVPVKMLEPELYTLSANDAGTEISFTDPTAGEQWLVPEGAVVSEASGTVELDDKGQLEKTSYTVTYTYGATEFTLDYQVTTVSAGREPLVPVLDGYVQLDDADAAYALEYAYGYLSQATHTTFTSNELTMSAAAAYALQTYQQIDAYDVDDTYAAKWSANTSAYDYSSGSNESQKVVQKFIDGKCTASVDDGRETVVDSVSQENMQDFVRSSLVAEIIANTYIESVVSTHLGSVVLFEYTGTEKLGEIYQDVICTSLFEDPDTLDNLASSYETNTMQFYVALDAYTLLPVSTGAKYEGVHVIQGQECILSQQIDQSFDLASLSAYDEIFEKPEPEAEPENPATPLFYRVTGADGQEMWLLGTIHVGDNRTAYLPQEIYDALLSADALALECDSETFEAQVEDDEELQSQVQDCYYYSDGTTTKDHIATPDLYESAIQMLKATGCYNINSEYAKPHVWSTGIEEFYLRQGYQMTREQGVEERLTDLAQENNIPIREVESSMFQIRMLTGFSDYLQEVMLYSAVAMNAIDYMKDTWELYELWCAGDEAALIEEIKYTLMEMKEEDFQMEDLTEEERERAEKALADLDNINAHLAELSEEYNNAISVDRNEGMLDVAIEYLESGETIFYAVGLAHLLAENGLVNSLRTAGYTVELVSYN